MSRIRTIKPDLFRHEALFDAELESGLPLRLAFIGLFTVADCEGRFIWKPRTLKLDVLPHDTVDFSAVLSALERAGFIERYEVDGVHYGLIPSFKKHQQIPSREQERGSSLPGKPVLDQVHVEARTEHEPVHVEARTEHCPELQEGEVEVEGNRKGNGNRKGENNAPARKTACPPDLAITPELQAWASEHGYHEDLQQHLDSFRDKAIAKGYQYSDWRAALRNAIRDDWACLRNPSTPKRPAAHGGSRNRISIPQTPQGAEFDAILNNMGRPVIEGEIVHELH